MHKKHTNVVITGGAGFIGSRCALYYARRGFRVTVVDNFFREKLTGIRGCSYHWRELTGYKNLRRVKGDIRNRAVVKEILAKGADLVIHTAAQPGVTFSLKNPYKDFSMNTTGTVTILEGIRRYTPQATLIYCSTNKVYGEKVNEIKIKERKHRFDYVTFKGIKEDFPTDGSFHTPYGISKYAADLYVQEYAYSYKIRTGVFRMSCIYGEGQFGAEEQGWVAHFIISTILKKPLTIYGNGKQTRDLLYVDDLIRAFNLYFHSNIPCALYNIGGGKNSSVSIIETLNILKKKIGCLPEIRHAPPRAGDQKVYITDISKIRRELGWKPSVDVETGIDKLTRWVKKNIHYL